MCPGAVIFIFEATFWFDALFLSLIYSFAAVWMLAIQWSQVVIVLVAPLICTSCFILGTIWNNALGFILICEFVAISPGTPWRNLEFFIDVTFMELILAIFVGTCTFSLSTSRFYALDFSWVRWAVTCCAKWNWFNFRVLFDAIFQIRLAEIPGAQLFVICTCFFGCFLCIFFLHKHFWF